MISLRASGATPGLESATRPAPDRAAASALNRPAPSMPGLPATTLTAPFHLCASVDRPGHQAEASDRSTRCCVALDTSSPMSVTSIAPHNCRPAPNTRPGLSAWNVTVRSASRTPGPASPVSAFTPLGMSTASTNGRSPGRLDVGSDPVAPESGAVGSIDHEVARGQLRRTLCGVDHADLDPSPLEVAARRSAVVAVVASAGENVDHATVGTTEHVDGDPRRRPAGPIDQLLDRFGRGGIDRPHLVRRHDRDHVSERNEARRSERPAGRFSRRAAIP